MITLKTLPQATAQQVFDQVAMHLLNQNAKSIANGICQYRAGSLSCAAGCLIGADEYRPEFEGQSWTYVVAKGLAPPAHATLIRELQHVHDVSGVMTWPWRLKQTAAKFELEFKEPR